MFKEMLKDKLNLALIAGIAICGIIVVSSLAPAVKAQDGYSTAINIVGKTSDEAVSQIVFPPGLTNAPVSNPFNNYDGSGDPQVLSDSGSEPVVRLWNNSGGPLLVRLEITGWTGGVVASEDYELVDTTNTTVAVVNDVLSSNGSANSVDTGVTINDGEYLDLYLEVVLGSSEGVSGGSTLTVLGEST